MKGLQDVLRSFLWLLFIGLLPFVGYSQQVEWSMDASGFFDNSEGDQTYRRTQTYAGMGISPIVGMSWNNGQHRFGVGANLITRWGNHEQRLTSSPLAYYQYKGNSFNFLIGNFMRDKLLGEYPEYLIADTIRYYRPVIQGMTFQYHQGNGHAEAFLDWTSAISKKNREQFMAGISTRFRLGSLLVIGAEGYCYHYALRDDGPETEHIHDYLIAHPYIGIVFDRPTSAARLELRTGALASFDRERTSEEGWHTPLGFLGEVHASYKHLSLKQTVYAGKNQQHFGKAHLGQFYWGDSYTQAPFYSRTHLSYQFIQNRFVSVGAGLIVNATRNGINHHQVVTLRLNFGSKDFRPLRIP